VFHILIPEIVLTAFFKYFVIIQLKEISIYFDENHKNTKWIYKYIIIYDYLIDKYYGTKINTNQAYHKYKLGIIKDIDPNHLSKIDKIIIVVHIHFIS